MIEHIRPRRVVPTYLLLCILLLTYATYQYTYMNVPYLHLLTSIWTRPWPISGAVSSSLRFVRCLREPALNNRRDLRPEHTMRTKCAISDVFARDCVFAFSHSVAQYVYSLSAEQFSDYAKAQSRTSVSEIAHFVRIV